MGDWFRSINLQDFTLPIYVFLFTIFSTVMYFVVERVFEIDIYQLISEVSKEYTSELVMAVVLLLFSTLVISQRAILKSIARERKLLRTVEAIAVRSKSLQTFPNSEDALVDIGSRIGSAVEVKNMFVGMGRDYTKNARHESLVKSTYEAWLAGPGEGTWSDIAGPGQYYSGRYSSLKKRKFGGRKLKIKILKHSLPLINFVILKFENGESEVCFGWRKNESTENSSIYRSCDEGIVGFFNEYFESLSGKTWNSDIQEGVEGGFELDLTAAVGNGRFADVREHMIDKMGCWVTAAYSEENGSWNLESLALIVNDVGEGRTTMDVRVFSPDLNEISIGTQHKVLFNSIDQLMVEFAEKDVGTNRGACHYWFQAAEPRDILRGIPWGNNSKKNISIFGVRLHSEPSFPDFVNGGLGPYFKQEIRKLQDEIYGTQGLTGELIDKELKPPVRFIS